MKRNTTASIITTTDNHSKSIGQLIAATAVTSLMAGGLLWGWVAIFKATEYRPEHPGRIVPMASDIRQARLDEASGHLAYKAALAGMKLSAEGQREWSENR
jgi:hypothetical protein